MIKFFQKLKAKKGFTLVELIVVIAIIGVLAAILVPTMLGYVTSSRVTSADTTAAKIEDTIDTFLTTADTSGYGMLQATTATALIKGECKANASGVGEWTITVTEGVANKTFKSSSSMSRSAAPQTGSANQPKGSVNLAQQLLAIEIANLFPDVTSCCFEAGLVAGDCAAVWYTADANVCANVNGLGGGKYVGAGDGKGGKFKAETFGWDGSTAGVSTDGYIVGTSPKLEMGATAS